MVVCTIIFVTTYGSMFDLLDFGMHFWKALAEIYQKNTLLQISELNIPVDVRR